MPRAQHVMEVESSQQTESELRKLGETSGIKVSLVTPGYHRVYLGIILQEPIIIDVSWSADYLLSLDKRIQEKEHYRRRKRICSVH